MKYTTSVTLLTAGHHIFGVGQTVWYHGRKWSGSLVYEATAVRRSKEKVERLSVYWWTRFSSQQEFFPCSIIAARLPTQTCTERAWITSWCHFLDFHSWSPQRTARFQMWAAGRRALDGPCTVNITYVNGPKRWSEEQRGHSSSTSWSNTAAFIWSIFRSWKNCHDNAENPACQLLAAGTAGMSKYV